MRSSEPFGLLITWTCYGTWLPGDSRGYVSNMQVDDSKWLGKENSPGAPYRANDPYATGQSRQRQRFPEIRLDSDRAITVADCLIEAARAQQWRILRAAIMANHVHVVIMNCPSDGPAVRRILKGTTQAALTRRERTARKWWTQGGSNRYLNGADSVEAAIMYVRDQEYVLVAIDDMRILS